MKFYNIFIFNIENKKLIIKLTEGIIYCFMFHFLKIISLKDKEKKEYKFVIFNKIKL